MRKNMKFALATVVIFLCVIIFIGYLAWKRSQETAMLSCLSSISAEANKEISAKKFTVNNQPRELTQSEVEQLLKQIKPYDCGSSQYSSEQIYVSVGDVNKNNPFIKIKVWMNGDDGIAGTDDDLVIPWGEKSY